MDTRFATLDDLDHLQPLFSAYLEHFEVAKPVAQVREFLHLRLPQTDSRILIAVEQNAEVQGFAQIYPLFDSLALRPLWLLSDLFVLPQARRRGIARRLLRAAHLHALASGASAMRLDTARSNHAAQALYESLGYVRDGVCYCYWLDLS